MSCLAVSKGYDNTTPVAAEPSEEQIYITLYFTLNSLNEGLCAYGHNPLVHNSKTRQSTTCPQRHSPNISSTSGRGCIMSSFMQDTRDPEEELGLLELLGEGCARFLSLICYC